ncbi:MAG: hypothetical protein KIT11_04410 [Fimbriimonadaceae bacterium]|nr:hypothetical protein [Fimbriimonadaceae bacterium]QYK56862.1 MAG: hypothetical protein KF733_05115 [Fimbriimonadaceae bacterium]
MRFGRLLIMVSAAGTLLLGLTWPSRPVVGEPVTFSRSIAPLIQTKCTPCHTRGGPAPFPLETYRQVKKRGDLVRRMMLTRQMPPCYGGSDFGEFCSAGGPITDEQGVLVQQWLNEGAPEGEPIEKLEVPDPTKWRMGEPDAILEFANGVETKLEGRPYWQGYALPLGALKGKRLRAIDLRANQPLAMRYSHFGIAKDGLTPQQLDPRGWETGGSIERFSKKLVGTWAPGYHPWKMPDGVSMKLDSDYLLVQPLYLPRGRHEDAGFKVALYFSDGTADKEPQWERVGDDRFAIPAPGAVLLEPVGELPPCRVIGVIPEARFFCSFAGVTVGEKHLFRSFRWEPYWTGSYCFPEPVPFPQGAKLQGRFQMDNDIHMGNNEGTRPVQILSGDDERDEMARIHVLYVRD